MRRITNDFLGATKNKAANLLRTIGKDCTILDKSLVSKRTVGDINSRVGAKIYSDKRAKFST